MTAPAYYTDDVARLPTGAVWRKMYRASGLWAVPFFPIFLVCKALRLRYRASYGVCRPDSLNLIAEEQVPWAVRLEFGPHICGCVEAGLDR